jgi:hypothetical protein
MRKTMKTDTSTHQCINTLLVFEKNWLTSIP